MRLSVRTTLGIAAVMALSACAVPLWLQGSERLEAVELGAATICPSEGPDAWIEVLDNVEAVRDWQQRHGLDLLKEPEGPGRRYALVGMGQRTTGGYGLAVSRAAHLAAGVLRLQATFVAPAAGGMRTQILTSPCALVRLPKGQWNAIAVYDQTGRERAVVAHP